jgi:hypothetical protein
MRERPSLLPRSFFLVVRTYDLRKPECINFEHSELVHIMLATGLGGSALVPLLYSNWLWLALLIPAYAFFGLVGWFSFLGALTIQ